MSEDFNRNGVLKIAFEELERARFAKDSQNNIIQRVGISGDTGLLEGVKYDKVVATYPTLASELYTYTLASIMQAQVLVTYTDDTKEIFVSAVKT